MPSSTPTRQAKRPYDGSQTHRQSTITAYFQTHEPTSSHPNSHQTPSTTSHATGSLLPPLPALVQSNLLSVGMRVRKSVPEGYKTGKLHDGSVAMTAASTVSKAPIERRGHGGTTRMELLPFCGIMKVGGMAVQQDWDHAFSSCHEDGGGIWSSQDSRVSVDSQREIARTGQKRRFDEDDDTDERLESGGIWQDEEVELSPKSRPIGLVGLGLGMRPVAIPKSRKRASSGGTKRAGGLEGQENLMDFEEADFLDYRVWNGEEVMMRDF